MCLSVGGLKDLALGRVVPVPEVSRARDVTFEAGDRVPEKLLNQVNVGEQHAAAAVAGQAQIVKSLSVSPGQASIQWVFFFSFGVSHTLQSGLHRSLGQSA